MNRNHVNSIFLSLLFMFVGHVNFLSAAELNEYSTNSGLMLTRVAHTLQEKNRLMNCLKKIFSSDMLAYLQEKMVPNDFKLELDEIFGNVEIQKAISILYSGSFIESLDAIEILEKNDFVFISGKRNIFTHKNYPNHIFKMPRPSNIKYFLGYYYEFINASRIRFADELKKIISYHKLKIKIPEKLAYCMPGADGISLPAIIVVATKCYDFEPITQKQNEDLMFLYYRGFDHNGVNALGRENCITIIDTEPYILVSLPILLIFFKWYYLYYPANKSPNKNLLLKKIVMALIIYKFFGNIKFKNQKISDILFECGASTFRAMLTNYLYDKFLFRYEPIK